MGKKKKKVKAKTKGIGAQFQKFKLIHDVAQPAIGTNLQPVDWKTKGRLALQRYTGYNIDTGTFDVNWVKAPYEGIIVSVGENWIDSKTGHAAGLSRGAIADWIEEGIPMFRAHLDADRHLEHSTTHHSQYWTKYRTGYDSADNTFDIGRAKEFLIAKAVRIGLRKSGIASWVNKRLPKKVNI